MENNVDSWIADYCEGSIGKEDFDRLREWIEESVENRTLFERVLRKYRDAQVVGFEEQFQANDSWKVFKRKLDRRTRRYMVWWMAAACILFCGVVGSWLYSSEEKMPVDTYPMMARVPGQAVVTLHMADGKYVELNNKESVWLQEKDGTGIRKDSTDNRLVYQATGVSSASVLHVVEVPVGGEFDVTLSDGTRVWLNSETELRFPTHFTGKNREVYLTGEAFFSVTPDVKHPFIVHASEGRVQVLGTEFNLSAYPGDRMVTTLSQGKVEVGDGNDRVSLIPGEQAILVKRGRGIEVCRVDAALYSSWVKGVFEYENMSLREICGRLARWYGVVFQFEDEACAERRFTGGIKKYLPLHQSLDILEKTTNVVFKMREKEIVVKSL